MWVLELSKVPNKVMYEFHYDFIKQIWKKKKDYYSQILTA